MPRPCRSYLDLDQAFHGLDFCFTESSSVLGADIRPDCQVGRLVCCLQHRHTHTRTVPACTSGVPLNQAAKQYWTGIAGSVGVLCRIARLRNLHRQHDREAQLDTWDLDLLCHLTSRPRVSLKFQHVLVTTSTLLLMLRVVSRCCDSMQLQDGIGM